ncbi:histone deacetylase [Colletotrichum fioriniae PJ7]|uniref:Histone deacetylase n=1 Tax=Colletotrichum fioriniae PJ7 TaxID=1445577 RepID=A0A010RY49_9PEZI|nr:histone deacetylase [Colletotrichum fioriniae PJ7]
MDTDAYRFRVPKPNYLPHRTDKDDIVEEYEPLGQASELDNAKYFAKCKRIAEESGITRPKGYNVSFHCNPEMEKHHFGQTHPMKPWRLTLSKSLIYSYGMSFAMDNYIARAATYEELNDFHSDDYLDFLGTVLPEPVPRDVENANPDLKFNLGGSDCPLFEGLYDYCSMSAGGSLDAARKICSNQSDIAVSWGGGLHHAKKAEASGFCYINDIVLAILQLLRCYPRVLYIDIDVHHGDGVEEAFYSTDRVMTVSFHKYDPLNFFPGTGGLDDNGPKNEHNPGAHHAINVPLNDGVTDDQYKWLFENVIGKCMEKFRPSAIALQCGADSLAGDRLGRFNLQVQGHGACVEFCKSFGVPMILFGGGGYTPRNVARAWAFETSIAIGCQDKIDPIIPTHAPWRDQFRYEELFPTLEQILGEPRVNRNTRKKLDEVLQHVTEQLRFVQAAPSVQYQTIPPDLGGLRDDVEAALKEQREAENDALALLAGAPAGILALAAPLAPRAVDYSKWKPGVSFQIVLHHPILAGSTADIVPANADVWDIDLQHAVDYPNIIPTLKSAGKIVMCYFNGGALQDWDEDLDSFPSDVIGSPLNPPYTDERYLNIKDARVVTLMKARLERAASIGCDAVDPDNIDAWAEDGDDPTGFNLQPADYATYISALAAHAHTLDTTAGSGRKLLLGQKNAPTIAPQLASVADFAVLETCLGTRTSDEVEPFCADFQPYIAAGKPVFQIEYPTSVRDDDSISQVDYNYFCVNKNGNEGFSEVLKHASEQVDGWGQFCGLGLTGGRFETPTVDEGDDEE